MNSRMQAPRTRTGSQRGQPHQRVEHQYYEQQQFGYGGGAAQSQLRQPTATTAAAVSSSRYSSVSATPSVHGYAEPQSMLRPPSTQSRFTSFDSHSNNFDNNNHNTSYGGMAATTASSSSAATSFIAAHEPPVLTKIQRQLLEKQAEYEELAAVRSLSAQVAEQLQTLNGQMEAMVEHNVAMSKVLEHWSNVFSDSAVLGLPESNDASRDDDKQQQQQQKQQQQQQQRVILRIDATVDNNATDSSS